MKVLLVAGSPRRASRVRRLVEHAADHGRRHHGEHEFDVLSLADEAPEPFRGFDVEYSDETRMAVRRVHEADAFILGSPVYNGTYSSALKNLFEFVDYKELEDRVAGYVFVGGGEVSFLQVRAHLGALMAYFNVHTVPRAVYARAEQVDAGPSPAILRRVDGLVDKVVVLREALLADGRRATPRAAPHTLNG